MSELQALSRLAVDVLDRVVTTPIQTTHGAIARRAFDGSGPGALPARVLHDRIAGLVYGALRAGGRAAGLAGERVAARRPPRPLDSSPKGRLALSALNALIGEELEEQASELAVKMALLRESAAATARIAVFVHGLGENEDAWRLGGGIPYGTRMARAFGHTPLYARYNTGLHISENGRRLSALLDATLAEWPVEAEEIVLVGHSMGGLVLRAACHDGAARGAPWIPLVRRVIYLGAPHLGAPLEQLVNAAGFALAAVPETRGLADVLRTRSAGIKDLRYGYVCDEDWAGHDADALLRNTGTDVPLLDGPEHCFVAACTGRNADGRLAGVIGDLLVGVASACGPRGSDVGLIEVRRLCGLNHFHLLNHTRVWEEIESWLRAGKEAVT